MEPASAQSTTNVFFAGPHSWFTSEGWETIKRYSKESKKPLENPATKQPLLMRLPIKSIDALLRALYGDQYDVDLIPVQDMTSQAIEINRAELERIAQHLAQQYAVALPTEQEKAERIQAAEPTGAMKPGLYDLGRLVSFIKLAIREKTSPRIKPYTQEEAIAYLQEQGIASNFFPHLIKLATVNDKIDRTRLQNYVSRIKKAKSNPAA
ncbi:hypothetical protein M1466_02970 [Candidatus Dependentiae bacterium]|nr:hypothetical protein [Candidatus Dependentiae bacterium]